MIEKDGGLKMITNTLLLKLKDRNKENIAKARDVLLGMQGRIEVLRDLKVAADIRHGPSSYDLMLIVKFDSMEDLNVYLTNPVHVGVGKYIAGVVDTSASVCYES
jgi:hypothetical protein